MNRRTFLMTSAGSVLAGCGQSRSGKPLTDLAAVRKIRSDFLDQLKAYRVAPTATFTTPKPPTDLLASLPELKGLVKVALRLHPRYSDEPKLHESKLGGTFLWPKEEPWPVSKSGVPYEPVLQLRADDAPPHCPFPTGTDLMQLLWLPRQDLLPIVAWRKASAVGTELAAAPEPEASVLTPIPCRLFPERVMELPGIDLLPEVMKAKIADRASYENLLSTAPGTKVGGYPRGLRPTDETNCPKCKKITDFLLTVDQSEWTSETKPRWQPEEERIKSLPNHAGLHFGETFGRVHIFICRRCEDWPIRAVVQNH